MTERFRVLSQFGPEINDIVRQVPADFELLRVPIAGNVPRAVRGEVFLVHYDTDLETFRDLIQRGVRWAHFYSTGINRYPIEEVDGKTVLTCSRGASAIPIAEFVLATILAFEKAIPEVWTSSEVGRGWTDRNAYAWTAMGELGERTVGIVGMGGIGRRVAQQCDALGMKAIGCRRHPLKGDDPTEIYLRPLEEVLALSDHIVIAAPLTSETFHLFSRETLSLTKRGVHLINVARGELVDNVALLEALESGQVRRASLDVVDPEPLPDGHAFYSHPSVRLSPHVAGASQRASERHLGVFCRNLLAFASGGKLEGVVSRDLGY